jgi:hypothetical protein
VLQVRKIVASLSGGHKLTDAAAQVLQAAQLRERLRLVLHHPRQRGRERRELLRVPLHA